MQTTRTSAIDDSLSEPHEATVEAMRRLPGDFIVLGAGGKMGPTLTAMVRRASAAAGVDRKVFAISRFSHAPARQFLRDFGVELLQGDLFDRAFFDSLPLCDNVICMVGRKFGSTESPASTWATNAFLCGSICQKYAGQRVLMFSTGNVYPMVPINSGGATEDDPVEPLGEYAMSAVARERMVQHFSNDADLAAVILRLNYATELRYGVLVDLAQRVHREEPISLATGHFNCIWQGDANNLALRSLELAQAPPRILNLTGHQTLATRDVCLRFGKLFDKSVTFVGEPEPTALLSNSSLAHRLLGMPKTSVDEMIEQTARWVREGGETLNAPTHFEARDGKF